MDPMLEIKVTEHGHTLPADVFTEVWSYLSQMQPSTNPHTSAPVTMADWEEIWENSQVVIGLNEAQKQEAIENADNADTPYPQEDPIPRNAVPVAVWYGEVTMWLFRDSELHLDTHSPTGELRRFFWTIP